MQLDTTKKGLEAIFHPWHVPLVDELFERYLSSGEAHKFLKDKEIRAFANARNTVSRASVIYFLSDMEELGLLDYTEFSGKGGWGRRYMMTLTREEFAHKIFDLFINKLREAFPEESKTLPWLKV